MSINVPRQRVQCQSMSSHPANIALHSSARILVGIWFFGTDSPRLYRPWAGFSGSAMVIDENGSQCANPVPTPTA
jgi:hypothetical protein